MSKTRNIQKSFKSTPVMEGAGVHLNRGFGFSELPMFDPFLMFDDFRSDNPDHFLKGFPWHPHRGIETITYVLDGNVEHGDSMGNKGIISSGDVQWMTAGSGIIHQEMPKGTADGRMEGFQLWANLPASQKMIDPSYRDVKSSQIPIVQLDNGTKIKIICGKIGEIKGPVGDIVIDPEYIDITVPADTAYNHPTKQGHNVFAYVIGGKGYFDRRKSTLADNETVILFGDGDEIAAGTENEPVRFLLVSGKPIDEPVAWRGPIVMNTQEELEIAFDEYEKGTFVRQK
ncbi:MAG: pirin family protein [Desulfobacterales bacterium]|nr:pirin family protein [Desulfobacterales bacterium]